LRRVRESIPLPTETFSGESWWQDQLAALPGL
jgi:hypothetical protein